MFKKNKFKNKSELRFHGRKELNCNNLTILIFDDKKMFKLILKDKYIKPFVKNFPKEYPPFLLLYHFPSKFQSLSNSNLKNPSRLYSYDFKD